MTAATKPDLRKEVDRLRRKVSELEAAAQKRDEVERALRESESRFQNLIGSNLVGVIFADIHGNITDANEYFLHMVGYDRRDLPLRWDLMTPVEMRDSDEIKVEEMQATGFTAPSEKEYIRKDGSRVPILLGAEMLYGSEEDCVGIVLDLSEAKRAETALRESEERYRALYENIPLMYFTLDADGVIQSVNYHGAAELGYTRDELIGTPVLNVFHTEEHEGVREQFQAALEQPGEVARWEFRKVRKDGNVLWVHEAARAVRGDDGRPVVLVVCEDVTERKEADAQLLEHQEQLRRLTSELALAEERERRRISRGLHDQIGQTLALVQMKLGELRHEALDTDARTRTEELSELVDQSVQAIRSLTFELSSPLLYELGLEAALQALAEQFEERYGVPCVCDIDTEPKALSDDTSVVLFQIVRELLFNIAKHAGARAAKVTVSSSRRQVQVTVEDDGVGFDATGIGEMPSASGGFGLFSIRERLNHLGGSFAIRSSAGEGTAVVISTPLR
ncbi:MAG: PAS domain S-box protein [bacterium]|nr:PAS domain S-box protein [bacterium]